MLFTDTHSISIGVTGYSQGCNRKPGRSAACCKLFVKGRLPAPRVIMPSIRQGTVQEAVAQVQAVDLEIAHRASEKTIESS